MPLLQEEALMSLLKRDEPFEEHIAMPVTWNSYLFTALRFIVLFGFFTLLIEEYIFFIHPGQPWIFADFLLLFFYLLIVFISLASMIKRLPMAAIMLAAPLIPLLMLILIVGSLPLLHFLHQHDPGMTIIKKPIPPIVASAS